MGRLTIYKDNYADATAVSNIFIDEYMKDANDAQLKIYLYLIRMMNANLSTSISDIADKFNHTEKDVLRALKYWEKNSLLSLEYDESKTLVGIHLLDFGRKKEPVEAKPLAPVVSLVAKSNMDNSAAVSAPAADGLPDASAASGLSHASAVELSHDTTAAAPTELTDAGNIYEKPSYSLDQLKAFKSNEETSQLLFIVEQYIGKTLTPTEIRTILFLSDRLGFSVELIDHLVEYCVERGKKDFRYIEKVAISWAQANISTPKQAVKYAYKYDKTVYEIMKALGKSSSPTNKEVDYINRWTKEFGFGMDVISVACERTVMGTDKHRFEYADSILSSWHQANIHHKADIAKADENYKRTKAAATVKPGAASNKFNQFKQNSYDFDDLEKKLLSN